MQPTSTFIKPLCLYDNNYTIHNHCGTVIPYTIPITYGIYGYKYFFRCEMSRYEFGVDWLRFVYILFNICVGGAGYQQVPPPDFSPSYI